MLFFLRVGSVFLLFDRSKVSWDKSKKKGDHLNRWHGQKAENAFNAQKNPRSDEILITGGIVFPDYRVAPAIQTVRPLDLSSSADLDPMN